jgi:predicted ribonuclease YlaK
LLELQEKLFDEQFIVSSKSIEELEGIKTSANKDADVKYKARQIVHLLNQNQDKYDVIIPNNITYDILKDMQLQVTSDNIIMACAYERNKLTGDIEFYTNDLCCNLIAKQIFGLKVLDVNINNQNTYKGFIEKVMSEEEMAYFYGHLKENIYDLLVNEYLLIKNEKCEEIECYKWDGFTYASLYRKPIKSIAFGDKMKPKDIYQTMAIDSMIKNTITAISGKAGSGKSLLSLMVAMHLIESGKYSRLVVMFNPTKTRGASDLGFYSGSFIEKAMQNSIGQILTTKFGDRMAVDMLIQQEKIKLVSMADARGIEIRDDEILYITECQNTSVDLLKLCLSRASSGCKIFIEGDYNTQVDSYLFDGNKNGMIRAIDVLKGENIFGYVELQHVWRSKIAELVDKL